MPADDYRHTQISPVRYFLWAVMIVCFVAAWTWRAEFWAWFSMVLVAGVAGFIWLTMSRLTTQHDGDALFVGFGPVPLFSTRIRYEHIREVHAGRSRIIDGWGLHYVPGRGWIWSLWGLGCVEVKRERSTIRIGTDDAENLARFLQTQMRGGRASVGPDVPVG